MTQDLPSNPEEYDAWYRGRKPDPRAEAVQFEAWMEEYGLSENQLSKRIGRPRAYIQQRRALLRASPALVAAWETQQITWTHLREICVGAPDNPAAQEAALAMVIKRRKGRKALDPTAIRMFARGAASRA